jgi:hypothetical protein
MSDNINVLSDADVILLKRMAEQFRKTQRGTTVPTPENEQHVASDCYLAKVTTQIPGRLGDEVFSDTCDLYRLTSEDIDGEVLLIEMGSEKVVYNTSEVPLPVGYTTIILTKQGKWVPAGGGAGTSFLKHLCRFVLIGDLSTSSIQQYATMTNEYGEGVSHASNQDQTGTGTATIESDDTIIVDNVETHVDDVYIFYGDSGFAGLAYYDRTEAGMEHWIIVNMEC